MKTKKDRIEVGDKVLIYYRYTDDGFVLTEVEVAEVIEDRREYIVLVPSLFGNGQFRCLVGEHHIHVPVSFAEYKRLNESEES